MATAIVPIDGQNIGLTGTAASNEIVLLVNVDTGDITSAVFNEVQIRNLEAGFAIQKTLVPVLGDRVNNLNQILANLVAVVPVSGQIAIGTQLVAGNVYRLEIGFVSDGSCILHVPHSIEGLTNFTPIIQLSAATITGRLPLANNSVELVEINSVAKSGAVTLSPGDASNQYVDTSVGNTTITTDFAGYSGASLSATVAVFVTGDAVNTLTLTVPPADGTLTWIGAAPAWAPGPNPTGAGNFLLVLTNTVTSGVSYVIASWQVLA